MSHEIILSRLCRKAIHTTMANYYVPDEMMLSSNDMELAGIQYLTELRVKPQQGNISYSYSGTRSIQFQWSQPELENLKNSYVVFKFTPTLSDGNVDVKGTFASASDLFDGFEFYKDSQPLVQPQKDHLNQIQNTLIMNEYSQHYLEHEASVNLGWSSQLINTHTNAQPSHQGARFYKVSLFELHAGMSWDKVHPSLGSQMRMILHLADPAKCLSLRSDADASYKLDDVELVLEVPVAQPDYRSTLLAQMSSDTGFKASYHDFDIDRFPITGNQTERLTVLNTHNNALSLYLFVETTDRKAEGTTPSFPSMNCDLMDRIENIKVSSGNRQFMGIDGHSNVVELYADLEKCTQNLNNISGIGCIPYDLITKSVKAGEPIVETFTRFAPVGINLSRIHAPDTMANLVNAGLSPSDWGVSSNIDVVITFKSGKKLDTTKESLWYALVYEKSMVVASKQVAILD